MSIINKYGRALLTAAVLTVGSICLTGCNSDKGAGPQSEDGRIPTEVGKTQDGHDVTLIPAERVNQTLVSISDPTPGGEFDAKRTLTFIGLTPGEIPTVGDIIGSSPTEKAPGGFLFKVTGVAQDNGATVVTVRQARLEEAIKNVDFTSETVMDFDNDGNLLKVTQRTAEGPKPFKIKGTLKDGLKDITVKVNEAPLSAQISFGVDVSYTKTFIFNIKVKNFQLDNSEMSVTNNGRTILTTSLAGKMDAEVFNENLLEMFTGVDGITLPPANFVIGGAVPVNIKSKLSLFGIVGGEAAAEVSSACTLDTWEKRGVKYQDGQFHIIDTSRSTKRFGYEYSLSGNFTIAVVGKLTANFYDNENFTVEISGGPGVRLEANAQTCCVHNYPGGFATADGDDAMLSFGYYLGIEAKLDVLGNNLLKSVSLGWDTWIPVDTFWSGSFLPTFDRPQITAAEGGVSVKSKLNKRTMSHRVLQYGLCVTDAPDGLCEDYKGKKIALGFDAKTDKDINKFIKDSDIAEAVDIETRGGFYVRPYFVNTLWGTYYDAGVYRTTRGYDDHYCTWTPWTVTAPATCEAAGVETRTCNQTGATEMQAIAKLTGARCETPSCTWTPWTVTTPATCAAEGVETRTCLQTGAAETRAVEKLTGEGCGTGGGVVGTNNCTSAATCGSKLMPDGKVWMTENLNIVTDSSWCYNDSSQYCAMYGRLYTWDDAITACPSGWHLPDTAEWRRLVEAAGGDDKAGIKLKSASGWNWNDYNNVSGNGTDDYGFSALPGGFGNGRAFYGAGQRSFWWAKENHPRYGGGEHYSRMMDNEYDGVDEMPSMGWGIYVRCISD